MTVEGRMERCLGEINRKMLLSRNPLMTRRVHPELTWYQKKDTSKLRKYMQCEPSYQEDHIKIDIMSKETLDGEENSIKNYAIEQDAECRN
jgi:hypothetical protein